MGQAQDNTADYWKGKASSYSSEKSYDMALESINKALNINSGDEAALNLKGGILIGLGRFDEAVSIFDLVISRNSKSKAAWKGKGYAYYRLGKYRDAVKCYDEALKIDDADAEALHYEGLALSQLGEKGEGEKLQERAVIIEPSYAYGKGSVGFSDVNILATLESSTGPVVDYIPHISIDHIRGKISARSAVPGGILESNNLVVPGGIVALSLVYFNSGGAIPNDPLDRDWARDVVVKVDYSTEVYMNPDGPRMTLVSSSIPPDSGTDDQWTIKNFRKGDEGRIDLVLRVPDGLRNTYFSLKTDWEITWMDVGNRESKTPSVEMHDHGDASYTTKVAGPEGPYWFEARPWEIFLSMGFPQFSMTKSASSSTIAPGEALTYTINYKNMGGSGEDYVYWEPAISTLPVVLMDPIKSDLNWTRDITITESYPSGVTFISADPAPDPGGNNQWTIKNVTKGSEGTIKVTVKVPEAPANVKFSSQESTSGVGFMRSTKDMTTKIQPYTLMNSVGMTYGTIKLQSATNSVTVRGDPGTKLLQRESGSGTYSSEAAVNYNRDTNYIREVEDLSARYNPTIFDLPQGRSIEYDSKWGKKTLAWNYLESESIQDSYLYADYLDRRGTVELSNNSTSMASEANFQGLRHLEYRKVSNTTDKGHRSTIQDLSQDYAGSFNVSEVIESRFINRTNAITEVKKYDEPHVTIYQKGEPDNADPANLNYVISILNDGNRRLGPIYVRDLFPAGADLSSTSISVSSSDSDYADWVFSDLPIGGSITIYLQVRIDSVIDPSINRVYATASYDGTSVSATSSVITNANWLGCSPDGECLGYSGDWKPPCGDQCIVT